MGTGVGLGLISKSEETPLVTMLSMIVIAMRLGLFSFRH